MFVGNVITLAQTMNLIVVLSLIVMPARVPFPCVRGQSRSQAHTEREIVSLEGEGAANCLFHDRKEGSNFIFATMATDNGMPELDDIQKKYFTKSQVEGKVVIDAHSRVGKSISKMDIDMLCSIYELAVHQLVPDQ